MKLSKGHVTILLAFVAGVVLAGQVRKLPLLNKLPTV
jgi:hypothetical protein